MLPLTWASLHPASSGHFVLSAGSYQRKRFLPQPPGLMVSGVILGFLRKQGGGGIPQAPTPHHEEATALPALTAALSSSVVGQKVGMQRCHLLGEMRCPERRFLPSTQGSLSVFLLPSSVLPSPKLPHPWLNTRVPYLPPFSVPSPILSFMFCVSRVSL